VAGDDERMRLFVALEPSASTTAALARWGAPVLAAHPRELRAVARDALHLTLCFLGWQPAALAAAIAAALERAVSGPPPVLALAEALWLPPRRPGVLAVAIADPDGQLGSLQRRVAEELVGLGAYQPEPRPFRPHVTVARVRRGAQLGAQRRALPAPPAPAPAPAPATGVVLLRSHLGPGGSRYESLWRQAPQLR
jgi:2'-5' RNA ligase